MIVAGFSAYSRVMDWSRFRAIADTVDAWLFVDMAHVAGLVAAGLYPNPVPVADVVTTTTHKTLRGPRGGLILARSNPEMEKKLNALVFPGIQGGPLMHVIAAKAVALKEALQPEFKAYQKQVIGGGGGGGPGGGGRERRRSPRGEGGLPVQDRHRPVLLAHGGAHARGALRRKRLEAAGELERGGRVKVELFGSLGATGAATAATRR